MRRSGAACPMIVAWFVAVGWSQPLRAQAILRSHAPAPGLSLLSPAEQQGVWTAVLRDIGATQEAGLESVEARSPNPLPARQPPRSAVLPILEVPRDAPAALLDHYWQRDLVRLQVIATVCIGTTRDQCHRRGERAYVSLGRPTRYTDDSVTVSVAETEIDVDLCRAHRGGFAVSKKTYIVARSAEGWGVAGMDSAALFSVSDGVCEAGRREPNPAERQPN